MSARRLALAVTASLWFGACYAADEPAARRYLRCAAVMHQAAAQSDMQTAQVARPRAVVFRVAASKVTSEAFVAAELSKVIEAFLAEANRQPVQSRGAFLHSQFMACNELFPAATAVVQ